MPPSDTPIVSTVLTDKVQGAMSGLGAIVFWEMSDTRITPADLRAILAAEGIKIDVPDIDPDSAVKRAARTWATGRVGSVDKFKADIVSTGNTDEVKVCIQRREENASGTKRASARWEMVESVVFSLVNRMWEASTWTPEVNGFVAMADQFIKFHDHNYLRPNVIQKSLVDMMAFSLKTSSGLWYVTQDRMADLASLQRVVASIGNSQMYVIHVGGSDSSREAIQTAARSALSESLQELEAKLETWIDSTRKIRTDAIDTTMAEFQELIDRADLYSGALQVRMDDLGARITVARDRARSIIDGNLTSHADPEKKPLGKRALQVLEAIEAGYPAPETFTIKALEEALGASPGTLQAHLRDLTRMGKVYRTGRDEQGAILFSLGASKDPEGEAARMDDAVSEESASSGQREELLPAKVKAEATQDSGVQTLTIEEIFDMRITADHLAPLPDGPTAAELASDDAVLADLDTATDAKMEKVAAEYDPSEGFSNENPEDPFMEEPKPDHISLQEIQEIQFKDEGGTGTIAMLEKQQSIMDDLEKVQALEVPLPDEKTEEVEEQSISIPTDEELAGMSRDALREIASELLKAGKPILKASKMGKKDLAEAIARIRDGE